MSCRIIFRTCPGKQKFNSVDSIIIEKIEVGWIDEDFLIDRLSARAHVKGENRGVLLFKLYKNGDITTFHEDREECVEHQVSPETREAVLKCKNIEVFSGAYRPEVSGLFSIGELMEEWADKTES